MLLNERLINTTFRSNIQRWLLFGYLICNRIYMFWEAWIYLGNQILFFVVSYLLKRFIRFICCLFYAKYLLFKSFCLLFKLFYHFLELFFVIECNKFLFGLICCKIRLFWGLMKRNVHFLEIFELFDQRFLLLINFLNPKSMRENWSQIKSLSFGCFNKIDEFEHVLQSGLNLPGCYVWIRG